MAPTSEAVVLGDLPGSGAGPKATGGGGAAHAGGAPGGLRGETQAA